MICVCKRNTILLIMITPQKGWEGCLVKINLSNEIMDNFKKWQWQENFTSQKSLTLRVVVWMRIVRRKCVLYLLTNIHLSIAVYSILAINSWTVTRYQTSSVVLGTKSGCLQYNVCKDKTITLLGTKTFTITVGLTYLFHDCVRREKATGFPHNSTGNYSLAWPHPVPQEREGVW